ncbi:SLAM family member 8-like [Colossoma macropomum]|uniref:SLAM family member 8-like n=1 Tax=Colossoma macropomum TaxID=42526 RepID=UPI0018640EB4|nr:SLAM family member 8-like [Colossoma macropomum]
MRTCYRYHVLSSGAALLVLCFGLCVWGDENTVTERRAAGSSLILPLGHPKESVSFAEWKYGAKIIAVYTQGQVHIDEPLFQFSGRLKVGSDDLSVEVTDLQLQDSGRYSIVADKSGVQLPTKTISLTVYGLCVWADENTVTECRAAGSSLILPLGHPEESVSFAQWRYEGKTFAVYRKGQVHITDELQFSGRLKVNSDDLSVEVTDLQLQDSGSYSITAHKSGVQLPTKIINLTVYAVLKTEIESSQTWVESKNSCEVHLLCKVREAEKVSYTWSGYKTDSGAGLHFTLSPAEGDVTLSCTAANSYSNDTKTMKVTCNPSKTPTVFSLLSSLMAVSPYLLVSIVLGVKCCRARAKPDEEKRAHAVIEDGAC